VFISSSDRLDP